MTDPARFVGVSGWAGSAVGPATNSLRLVPRLPVSISGEVGGAVSGLLKVSMMNGWVRAYGWMVNLTAV